ncbi:MAG: acylphosphatase [Nanopusillaceae archaeon]
MRAHLRIYGLVQGVFFRSTMRDVALRLGVAGWVRNLPDGSVEAVVEGVPARVEELIKWARRGPPTAVVEKVEVKYSECTREFKTFKIRY